MLRQSQTGNPKSSYEGVYQASSTNKDKTWFAGYRKDGKLKHIGTYATEEEAAEAYEDFLTRPDRNGGDNESLRKRQEKIAAEVITEHPESWPGNGPTPRKDLMDAYQEMEPAPALSADGTGFAMPSVLTYNDVVAPRIPETILPARQLDPLTIEAEVIRRIADILTHLNRGARDRVMAFFTGHQQDELTRQQRIPGRI